MPILSEATRSSARRMLLERARALRSIEFGPEVEKTFTLAEIRAGAAEAGIAAWLAGEVWPYARAQPALYTISASNVATAYEIDRAFPRGQTREQRGYSVPRADRRAAGSTTLYVGSSEKIRQRLKEHLWQARPKTYALNLQRWCPHGDGSVRVRVQPILNNRERQIRQDLEDFVWRELTPVYGKQGGR
ncbi:MAG: hypothetical protein KDK08_26730 [Rhizobiaceae bacterium]|nr:hypothetical protein [Rhizobiaceae bacterium]